MSIDSRNDLDHLHHTLSFLSYKFTNGSDFDPIQVTQGPGKKTKWQSETVHHMLLNFNFVHYDQEFSHEMC